MASLSEILKISGSLEKAEEMAQEMARKDQGFLLDLQLVLGARGKVEETKKLIDYLSEAHPEDHRIAFNKGWHVLNEGDFQKGMELIDRGRFVEVFGSKPPFANKAVWKKGNSTKHKTILLRSEGGLGDEIINVRFAKDLADAGAKVVVSAHPSLVSLFSRVDGVSKVIPTQSLAPHMYDEWLPAMSAGLHVGHTYETLPNKKYISALPEKIQEWQNIIHKKEGILNIGIRWAGNPQFEHEQYRKFPVEPLLELAKIPGVRLYSLQRDADLVQLPENITDLSGKLKTWEDTAAGIENLDLVITSCTSIAHLAGAMGKETWILVPIMPYYTWALPGEKSPWYESVRLFRQTNELNWNEPFKDLKNALRDKISGIKNIPRQSEPTTKHASIPVMNPNAQTLHFIAGLPRSGSTLLTSLLSQNPSIYGAPVSGLCGIVYGVNTNWDKIEFHKEVPNEEAKIRVLRAMLDRYHAGTDKPIVIDKERHWIKQIALLEKVLGRNVKMIIPVRPLVEILTSFEILRQKDPLNFTVVDEQLAERSTLSSRCEYFMADNGPIGTCYNFTKDAVISGFKDRMLFVDYNKLMMNPERDLKRIYEFLEIPYFEHDLSHIKQVVETDDSVWRYPGLHSVRQEFGRISAEPIQVLGPELVARYSKVEPWEEWT